MGIPTKIGRYGWIAILFVVLGIDIPVMAHNELERKKAEENIDYDAEYIKTISDWCWEAIEHPIKRYLVFTIMLILVKHLAAPNFLRRYDPIGAVGLCIKVAMKHGR